MWHLRLARQSKGRVDRQGGLWWFGAGIIERLRQATNILTSEKDKLKLEMSVDRLIHPKKMGSLFKCLIVTNEN